MTIGGESDEEFTDRVIAESHALAIRLTILPAVPPRPMLHQIWTVAELNALPDFAIVRTSHGNALLKHRGVWLVTGGDDQSPWIPDETVSVPYLLLWHPGWA